ncbi:SRPBCC domain-containing protein [Acinetobacter sp. ANC 3813]|uniref:SRPBCC domain-containing protein n=1 Tax=Acinetobacter sp. ANC 3813 TaxID=1977873 RepID=UPI000A348E72|nr:SRPBCC domain-containing protein [Acinetobacter sp. ANC 3813]OTG91657.1 polyketide cyclase [Acinetobacter sp. ANC 3813]
MNTVIETQMLIRKSVNIVFNAFVDPLITSQFWFSHSTGYLEKGKSVQWSWQKYNAKADVQVLDIQENALIRIEWGEPKSKVDFIFEKISAMETYLRIKNYDIPLEGQALMDFVIDSTGGFTTVLDAAKIHLEHGIQSNLIWDKFPPFK